MSELVFKLLLHLCVWNKIYQVNGIQNLRYPTRYDNNQWRFGKRQDFLTKSRFLMWKPPISPGHKYSNVKTPAIPLNFNRYGIQSPPIMAPIHHSYMFAIPTKINYASYQPAKEIEENRYELAKLKPGNLHHITIINTVLPKPYLPTTPTHIHSTTTFQNYRRNNKQLYYPYFNNFAHQNMENYNKINAQQLQLQKQQQQQHQPHQMGYSSSQFALQLNKPTIEYMNVKNYNNKNNNMDQEANEINSPISQCGQKSRDDTNNSGSNILYYYCNNRITNYKNPTQEQLISIQPTTTSTSTSTTTTTSTTTKVPPITSTKSSRKDFNIFTTELPIFLPTPNAPLENSFIPITSTSIFKNSVSDLRNDDNFKLQRQKNRQKKYEHQGQTLSRYEDMKRQQPYATAGTYENMKFHSFFTIEDAVTRSPEMQVFNDPHQAYRHARRQKTNNNNQRQTTSATKMTDTTTTTSKTNFKSFFDDEDYPEAKIHAKRQETNKQRQTFTTTKILETTTTKPKLKKSFFDDLDDEDYILPEVNQYDYSLFRNSQKSVYHKPELKTDHQFPKHNQVISDTRQATEENEFIDVDETFVGRPKIKEHQFGLFNLVVPTSYALAAVTTYKPNGNVKESFLTTQNSKPHTTTLDTVFGIAGAVTEKENTTVYLNENHTTATIPVTTIGEKKSRRITYKAPLNLRSSTAFKYPKQSSVQKLKKNLTSTTTKATIALKKVPKYQRQYKTKKLKQFKHLYTTSTTTTSSTTISDNTTIIPTTVESQANRGSLRLLPTTSTTEEPTTKRAVFYRTSSTTEAPKQNKWRQQPSTTTEATRRKKVKSRTSTASTTTTNDSSVRIQSKRRGSKRANTANSEKETTQYTMTKVNNKKRQRLTSSSTTTKPLVNRTTSGYSSTTPATVNPRTSSSTTTMKSIMRISNNKPRTKLYSDVRSPMKATNEVSDGRQDVNGKMFSNSLTSTMANIPALPIEIYFRKSHSPKI